MNNDRLLPVSDETRKAVDRVYRKYYQSVFNYVKYIVKKHEDANEVVSDVFAKIMNNYNNPETRYNPERKGKDGSTSNETSYVRTVTNAIILDFFRTNHQDRYKAVSNFIDCNGRDSFNFNDFALAPDKVMENHELKKKLLKTFRELKPSYRKIATMYFIREMSYEEIADIMVIPMGTVKGTINRARTKLQKELKSLHTQKLEMA